MTNQELLTELYIGYFCRAPEPEGLAFWENVLEGGFALTAIAEDFATQPEAIGHYPELANPATADATSFLTDVYMNLFNRTPDVPGLTFWLDVLAQGQSIGNIILDIIQGATGDDVAILANKVDLAKTWTELATIEPDFALTDAAIASSEDALVLVGADPTSTQGEALEIVLLFFNDPASVTAARLVSSLADDTNTSARIKIAELNIQDDDIGTNTLSLTGADADLFELDGTSLYLKAGTALDIDTNPRLDVRVVVSDPVLVGQTPNGTSVSLPITQTTEPPAEPPTLANNAPIFVPADALTMVSVGNLVTDGSNDLSRGFVDLERDRFILTATGLPDWLAMDENGALTLIDTPDLGDFGASPITLLAVDTPGGSTTVERVFDLALAHDFGRNFANGSDEEIIGSQFADIIHVGANAGTNGSLMIDAGAGADTIRIGNGANNVTINLGTNDAAPDMLSFDRSTANTTINGWALGDVIDLDRESNWGGEVVGGNTVFTNLQTGSQITLTGITTPAPNVIIPGINTAPTLALSGTTLALAENADTTARTKVADIVVTDDGIGSNDLTLTGADMGLFEIDGTELFLRAGVDLDFETNPALDVTVAVDDASIGATPNATAALQIAVTDVLEIPTIEISEIRQDTDPRGFAVLGINRNEVSGQVVSNAGDVNGDGLDDLLIGASQASPNGALSGAAYVVFGKADGTALELSEIEQSSDARGFVLNGTAETDRAGISLSAAGDVNGDGLADVIVGAPDASGNAEGAGISYVVFGKADGTVIELSDISAGTGGFAINGAFRDQAGAPVSTAGDVNGDGFADLIIGVQRDDPNGQDSGATFVVFGKADGDPVEIADVAAGADGFEIQGLTINGLLGFSVDTAGDINGDGLDDLIFGALNVDSFAAGYVVFGNVDGANVEISDLENGIGGFLIKSAPQTGVIGATLSTAGDVNGDGFDDLIIGASRADTNGQNSGASFVVFGKDDSEEVQLSAIETAGIGGFVINGEAASAFSGLSVSEAGDVNGDGLDDLIVGGARSSFVILGKTDTTEIDLETISRGSEGFEINIRGVSVSTAGDVNGDGFDDLIIGDTGDATNGELSGASFVVFGDDFTESATEIGSTGADTLTGTNAVDRLIGGTGGDTLIGNGGADVLRGGEGDDVLAISDLGFADISGGNGTDTLRLDGSGLSLDLERVAAPALTGIERIDLGGNGNELVLNTLELLGLSDNSNTLRVTGTAADSIILRGTQWGLDGTVTDGGVTFDVITDGNARLEVAQGIALTGGPIAAVELSQVRQDSDARGFVINSLEGDKWGKLVSDAGDVNGDGLDDLIIGAQATESFVVFGKSDGTAVALFEADTNGFLINGLSGISSISSAGDVNGDGLDDLIFGTPFADSDGFASGDSFVVFGKTDRDVVELSDIENGIGGFFIDGVEEFGQVGFSVSGAGDVNGDGLDDLIVAASRRDLNSNDIAPREGYVVFGKTDGDAVELSAIENGAGGFFMSNTFLSAEYSITVSNAGDVNGDGLDDLIVGTQGTTPGGQNGAGFSYVVFGKADGDVIDLAAVATTGVGGFGINGAAQSDFSGSSVSSAGDVNGDGLDDLIIGAQLADPDGKNNAGISYVVFGKADGDLVELAAVATTGAGGFVINGAAERDNSGRSVSSAGDVNGDGLDDLIIGARYADPNGADSGASFVVYGKTDRDAVELSDVKNGKGGFVINGDEEFNQSGASVSGAGDVNGDGFDDLIVGSPNSDRTFYRRPISDAKGESFVIFGGDSTGATTQVGGMGDDVMAGTAFDDVIFAGMGDDTITIGGGDDRVSGAKGADTYTFLDLAGTVTVRDFVTSDHVSPTEHDTLDVSAFDFADFTAFAATLAPEGPGGHDTRITLDADTFVVLIGVESDDITLADVLL